MELAETCLFLLFVDDLSFCVYPLLTIYLLMPIFEIFRFFV